MSFDKAVEKASNNWWFWAGGAVLGVGAIAYLAVKGRQLTENLQERSVNRSIDSKDSSKSIAPLLAQQAAAAMNPSGISWMRYTDGTNEETLYKVADAIRAKKASWTEVANSYNAQYHRNLIEDLTDELDSEDLITFWSRAGKTYSGISSLTGII